MFLLISIFLAAATFVVYWPVCNYDFVNYDDNVYVTDNAHIQSGFTLESIRWALSKPVARNWHPLVCLSYMLDYRIFGLDAGGFHMTNVVFHVANTLLLFLVLGKISGRIWQSAFVAAAFALHPLHIESVAWIAERKDVLSSFFWMLTIAAYVRYARRPSVKRYVPVLLAFILGLLSKAMLVTLPFVLLLLDYWPLNRTQRAKADSNSDSDNADSPSGLYQRRTFGALVKEKIPLFIFSVVFSVIAVLTQRRGGTMHSLEIIPLHIRIANALVSYVKYIQKMIIPARLAVLYPHQVHKLAWSHVIIAGLVLVGLSFIIIRYRRRRPYLAVGWLWYLGTLVPVIGLVQVGVQAMADRYSYIPLTGLFIIIAWGAAELMSRWRYRKVALGLAAGLILAGLMVTSRLQLRHWENSIALFKHAISVTDNNATAHNNLATALDDEGESEAAIEHYLKALEIKPNYAKARFNLGNSLVHLGRFDEAVEQWTEVLRIKPKFVDALINIGCVLTRQGKFEEAIEHYQRALAFKPGDATAESNLAKTRQRQREMKEVLNYYGRGNELAKQQKFSEAIASYHQALQINPNFAPAHNNLANVYILLGEFDKAFYHNSKALKINPNFADAHHNLGVLLSQQGKVEQAVCEYRKALEIDPNHSKSRDALQHLLEKTK